MNTYSYKSENNSFFLHILYYSLVVLFWFSNEKIHPFLVVLFFILIASVLIYSMIINNYKLLPARKLGVFLYWFRLFLKILFYFILIVYIPQNNENHIKVISCFGLFCIIELCIGVIYIKFKENLFYDFRDKDIENALNNLVKTKKYRKMLNKKLRIFLIGVLSLYPVFLWFELGKNLWMLFFIIVYELLLFAILFTRRN